MCPVLYIDVLYVDVFYIDNQREKKKTKKKMLGCGLGR